MEVSEWKRATNPFWDCHLRTKAFLINDFASVPVLISPLHEHGSSELKKKIKNQFLKCEKKMNRKLNAACRKGLKNPSQSTLLYYILMTFGLCMRVFFVSPENRSLTFCIFNESFIQRRYFFITEEFFFHVTFIHGIRIISF